MASDHNTPSEQGTQAPSPELQALRKEDTRILRLYRAYQALRVASHGHVFSGKAYDDEEFQDEDAELEALFLTPADQIMELMLTLPCTCAADFAAKMLASHRDGDHSCLGEDHAVWLEARSLVGGSSDA